MGVTKSKVHKPARQEGTITLSGLRAFVAVAEAKSFSAAAQRLGVTQPSVSVQLAALEEACGVLLLHRKPQLALTEPGLDLFVRARLVLSRVDEFDASTRDLRDVRSGRLTVGLSAPVAAMRQLAAFRARHPQIRVTTQIGNTTTLLDDVARCRIDIGIMTLKEPQPEFYCMLMAAPRLAICVRRDDPLAGRASVRAADLAGREFVMREEGSQTRNALEDAFAAQGVPLKQSFVLGSREAMCEAVAAGLGIGALFEDEARHDVRLAGVPFVGVSGSTGIYAVALKESLDIPAVRAFLETIPGPGTG